MSWKKDGKMRLPPLQRGCWCECKLTSERVHCPIHMLGSKLNTKGFLKLQYW
jgi:hypothetical protein